MEIILNEDDLYRLYKDREALKRARLDFLSDTWRSLVQLKSELMNLSILSNRSSLGVVTLLKAEVVTDFDMNFHKLVPIDIKNFINPLIIAHQTVFCTIIGEPPAPVHLP